MGIFESAVLGLLQGLGEFLPISSSAHLALFPWIFGLQYQGLAYDVMLHMGTLAAVLAYYWKDWVKILKDGFSSPSSEDGRALWLLVLATVPGGLAGLFLEHYAESAFRNPVYMAVNLIVFGFVLWYADSRVREGEDRRIDWKTALVIGCAQALAIAPGVSRSGITMTAALFLGFSRGSAARFSFLLSTPIIAAAGLKEIVKLQPSDFNASFGIGFIVAAVSGWLAISFLISYIKRRGMALFAWYRLALGIAIIVMALLGH